MPNFSSIAEPITRLTRKNELFAWRPEQQAAKVVNNPKSSLADYPHPSA